MQDKLNMLLCVCQMPCGKVCLGSANLHEDRQSVPNVGVPTGCIPIHSERVIIKIIAG